ncbi:MAG: response regulator [Calditrichaeota bacterium]|nr:MAG: response regulator [Calditrichota bacterium]
MKDSTNLLSAIIESPKNIVIFALNKNYEYLAFNQNHKDTIHKIWGVEIEVGMNMLKIIKIIEDRKKAKKNFDRALLGERFTLIEKYGEPPNRLFFENTYNPVKNRNSEIIGLTVFLTDITQKVESAESIKKYHEQLEELVEKRTAKLKRINQELLKENFEKRKIEKQLFQSQKLEAIGDLAGGIAHDFKNLLTTILGNSDVLAKELNESKELLIKISEIQSASKKANDLTEQLLAFSRKQILIQDVFDLNLTIVNMEKFFQRIIGNNIFINTIYDFNIKQIRADQNQIEQIILQLLVNSKDALPNGGKITIQTKNVSVTKELTSQIPYSRAGEFVCLSIEDNGIGMDEETTLKIFEPFFSTKQSGNGTGLGLSVVYGIIKQHDGWVNVISSKNKGTKFNIYFPSLVLTTKVTKSENYIFKDFQGKGELILIVEDESEVREIAKIILTENGYKTLEAKSAEEALVIFLQNINKIDLIFADIVLPKKSGLELRKQIQTFRPNSKILFTSGHTTENLKLNLSMEKGSKFLFKPYNMRELLKAIKTSLE